MVFFWRPKKILIIEDNADLVNFIKRILEASHFVVFSSTTGKGAVDLAVEKRPDVIILDIMIPDMSGQEIEGLLREEPITRNTPVIYMTALVSREEEEQAKSAPEGRILLSKPVTSARLLSAIDLAFSRK